MYTKRGIFKQKFKYKHYQHYYSTTPLHNENTQKKHPNQKKKLYASGPRYVGSASAGSGSASSVDFRLGRSCTRTVSAECIN